MRTFVGRPLSDKSVFHSAISTVFYAHILSRNELMRGAALFAGSKSTCLLRAILALHGRFFTYGSYRATQKLLTQYPLTTRMPRLLRFQAACIWEKIAMPTAPFGSAHRLENIGRTQARNMRGLAQYGTDPPLDHLAFSMQIPSRLIYMQIMSLAFCI